MIAYPYRKRRCIMGRNKKWGNITIADEDRTKLEKSPILKLKNIAKYSVQKSFFSVLMVCRTQILPPQ